MDENNEKVILYHQRKRRKHKIKLGITSAIFIIAGLIIIITYLMLNKEYTINYTETSNINYSVNLIENEFYKEDHLNEGINIISNLINNIDVEFKYNLDLQEEIEYTYNYKILAETEVKEKYKRNLIYETKQELLNKPVQEGKSNNLEIIEKINVNYNEYNDQINKLLDAYELKDTTSKLDLNMYIDVVDKTTGQIISENGKVMSLEIPLTTKTVEISINENAKGNKGKIIIQEGQLENSKYIILIGTIILIIGLIILARLIKYISDTRSAEKMYEIELKKILFDYKSYIQKINNQLDYSGYKIIKIDTFKELMEMREEIQSPILMYTQERMTTFTMLNGSLLFEYILGADLIRADLIKKSKDKEKRKNEKSK